MIYTSSNNYSENCAQKGFGGFYQFSNLYNYRVIYTRVGPSVIILPVNGWNFINLPNFSIIKFHATHTVQWEIRAKENICDFYVFMAIHECFLADLLVFA